MSAGSRADSTTCCNLLMVPKHLPRLLSAAGLVLALGATAAAQTTQPPPGQPPAGQASDDGWKFAVYPVFAWIPLGINIDVSVPPVEGGGGGAGGSGQT